MIRVDVRSGSGDLLVSVPAGPGFDPVLHGVNRKKYPILGHLDPYGDTVLNQMQVSTLLEEISELKHDPTIITSEFAEILIDLCRECLRKPHRFVWFVGD